MERKNTMLLTVIAVATLLVAVVGATFAYYSVTGTNTSTTNTVSTTTQKVGTVTLAEQDEQLYLNVTANQLAKSLAGHDYWATTENGNAAESQQTHTLASITVAGGETTTKYHCTFKLTVTTTQTSGSNAESYGALEDRDAEIIITSSPSITGLTSPVKLNAAKTPVVMNGAFDFTGDTTAAQTITGEVVFHNLADTTADEQTVSGNQNRIKELGITTTANVSEFTCDTVNS